MKISDEQRLMLREIYKGDIIKPQYKSVFNLIHRVLKSNEYNTADKTALNFLRDTYIKHKGYGNKR